MTNKTKKEILDRLGGKGKIHQSDYDKVTERLNVVEEANKEENQNLKEQIDSIDFGGVIFGVS